MPGHYISSIAKKLIERYDVVDIAAYKDLNEKFRLKYSLDRLTACFLLALLSPIFLLIILWVKLDGLFFPEDSGSVFYLEPRISAGKVFNIIKFRTVTMAATKEIKSKPDTKSITGSLHTTHAGKMILKWYMDELPQLFNIAKGEMSFVGPRPHILNQHNQEIAAGLIYRDVIKAGLLGIPQVCKRRPKYAKLLQRMALKHKPVSRTLNTLDGLYAKKCLNKAPLQIILLDLYIILQGLIVIVRGEKQ